MPDRDLAARRLLAVAEEELQRIVLDIHDGPVQNLFAALSQLALLRAHMLALPEAPPECAPVLARAISLLELSLTDIRNLLGAFRAPEFTERGLAEIVEDLAVQHETFTGGVATLEIKEPLPNVPLPVKIALYRALQESLSNATRHGRSDDVRVLLAGRSGARPERSTGLELVVSDDGAGFDPRLLGSSEGLGLAGIREQAEILGGSFSVTSAPGAGTELRVWWPLHEYADDDDAPAKAQG